MKTYILGTSGFLLLILGIIFIMTRPGGAARFWPGGPEAARLSRVVDGDTLVVIMEGKSESVRLLGVDAAEIDYSRALTTSTQPCFALEAKVELERLLARQDMVLEPDKENENRDAYGRLLRYVYLPDGTMANLQLIEGGHALFLSSYPLSQAEDLASAEEAARTAGRGLWSACVPND